MRKILFPALILSLCVGYGVMKSKVDARMVSRREKMDIRYLPSPQTAEFLAAGYKPALSDLFWIEALNYFGQELVNKNKTYVYIPQYLDVILHLDPLFNMFYEWASTIAIYNGLPVTRKSVTFALKYANEGISNLAAVRRYDSAIISKAAFNYALEAQDHAHSIPYFAMVGRIFDSSRDLLLVGSSYASMAGLESDSTELKLEYLGFMAFEAQSKSQILYALQVLSSQRFNKDASDIVRSLRLNMEKDEDIKKLVNNRLSSQALDLSRTQSNLDLPSNPKLEKILKVDFQRTWLPPDLHMLFML